ncbi:acyl-CoA dehydrogenase family protein [Actinomadura sp. WAC 06369]|uniref:acyl-CoA dehydrogenase family protein n=1 Tax=Actinomadura sp. WAC 06369 TaxID=2203193 RepID=UPI0018F645BF|nr:acyl-CoA dehydrogenase family protein [Actinomadura sp. WAC 06369]
MEPPAPESPAMDAAEREMLADALRRTMAAASGPGLDAALAELGWPDLLAAAPDVAVPLVFGLLGETGAHAAVLNDVVLNDVAPGASGRPAGDAPPPLPYAGGRWVVWDRGPGDRGADVLDGDLPLRPVPDGAPVPLAAGRRALGWWLAGTGRAMLRLARGHALDRAQFGRPIAAFQAVRHRLAETLVELEGAEAALAAPHAPADADLAALLGKAAAGRAALTAARHCQQVLGGIGFTEEHELHRHVRRALVLDGLLGGSRELTREAGRILRAEGAARRLVEL